MADVVLPVTQWADAFPPLAAGKVGMFVGAPDVIQRLVETLNANPKTFGLAPLPGASGAAAATLISICCVPSLGCFTRSTIVPGCSVARIQIAPVPPVSAKGLSPMIWPGPVVRRQSDHSQWA